jgi:hypothetical protein
VNQKERIDAIANAVEKQKSLLTLNVPYKGLVEVSIVPEKKKRPKKKPQSKKKY